MKLYNFEILGYDIGKCDLCPGIFCRDAKIMLDGEMLEVRLKFMPVNGRRASMQSGIHPVITACKHRNLIQRRIIRAEAINLKKSDVQQHS